MNDNLLKSQVFKFKGRLYTLTVLQLLDTDSTKISSQLTDVIAQAPKLFDQTPIVIDCSDLSNDENGVSLDLHALCDDMRQKGLLPIAIQGGSADMHEQAHTQGLAVLHASSTQDKPLASHPVMPSLTEGVTKLLTTQVRSGQQVVSKGGDLVITASVSHGAELLADGNIHVYGALRGRALAGISGDKQARIFCQSLDAELVSIAGVYRLSDSIQPVSTPCQIFIQDDRIQIEPL